MKFKTITSLGIDISEDRISIALLKHTASGLRLLKADHVEMPAGAFGSGTVRNHSAIGAAIRKLLRKNFIHARQAVVSLCTKPILTQIIELPEDIPENMSHFVHSEIRHSPTLSGKEPQFDYHRLASPGQDRINRVFVGASDSDKVTDVLKACSAAGVDATVLEVPVISALRAVHSKKVSNIYDCNICIVVLHGTAMTTSVFRKDELDFIRTIDMSDRIDDQDAYMEQLHTEINAVIQYYDIEVESAENRWEVLTVLESPRIDRNDLEFVLQKHFGVTTSVCTPSDISSCLSMTINGSIKECSITAAGLAMRNLPLDDTVPAINLMPQDAKDARDTKKFALLTANVAAVALFLVIILAGVVRLQVGKTQQRMEDRVKTQPQNSIERLISTQRRMNSQIAFLTDKKTRMKQVFAGDKMYAWPEILEEIRKNVPSSLYITTLAMTEGTDFMIEGNATSFKSIHVFAELLRNSPYFQSAVVGRTEKSSKVNGLVAYSVACILTENQGKI